MPLFIASFKRAIPSHRFYLEQKHGLVKLKLLHFLMWVASHPILVENFSLGVKLTQTNFIRRVQIYFKLFTDVASHLPRAISDKAFESHS